MDSTKTRTVRPIEIRDPYGGAADDFARTYDLIRRALDADGDVLRERLQLLVRAIHQDVDLYSGLLKPGAAVELGKTQSLTPPRRERSA